VDPSCCLVIEDTPTGVQAGVSAGATVWAYLSNTNQQKIQAIELVEAGAQKIFSSMQEMHSYLEKSASNQLS